MTEANPPAQPDKKELRRRILFLLQEKDRQDEYRHLFQIASDLEETPKDVRDQLKILECDGLIEVTFFTNGDALPFITGKGLKLEKIAQTAPQPDPPPISETSSESQEFQHSPDYASVNWRGQEYQFTKNQATCVRLLHEAWLEGTPYLSADYLLSEILSASRMSDLFKRHPAWGSLIVLGERRATYGLKLSPKLPLNSPETPPKVSE